MCYIVTEEKKKETNCQPGVHRLSPSFSWIPKWIHRQEDVGVIALHSALIQDKKHITKKKKKEFLTAS